MSGIGPVPLFARNAWDGEQAIQPGGRRDVWTLPMISVSW